MKLIDLTMTIEPSWRWPVEIKKVREFEKGDPYQATVAVLPMHCYTHTDTPLHVDPAGHPMEELDLNRVSGPALVADLSFVGPNQEIGPEILAAATGQLQPDDVLLLKTCWDLQRSYAKREYWTDSPFVSEAGARFLAELPIKAIGFDFPQDYTIREIPERHPRVEEMPCHNLLLRKGVYQIEYLCNLAEAPSGRATFLAFPLKVKGAEGAPTRAALLV